MADNKKLERLYRGERRSAAATVIGFVTLVLGIISAAGYSSAIEQEKYNDPEYRAQKAKEREEQQRIREKELDLEREKLKVEQENKRLDEVREKNFNILRKIDEYADQTGELDDYGMIDTAYRIRDLLKAEGITEQTKYRAMACISGFADSCGHYNTQDKLDDIIDEIKATID